ncbi:Rco1 protein [Maudiozyma humilis]|uniref:Rco1 protein n=1 Tax=Maudiozyma humilis TaxID=51915 RepID=A0AAV5S288_MAUHU|nr:hypothetical protein DAKH74_040180 [Kazachstania humilis]GMM58125.1 Rco1 protein [Kazachstania humilis]
MSTQREHKAGSPQDSGLAGVAAASTASAASADGSASDSSASTRHRRERAASRNVNYSLKRRRVGQELKEESVSASEGSVGTPGAASDSPAVPPQDVEPVAVSTGLPLSAGPPEKVKKESLWHYKKNSGTLVAVQQSSTEYPLRTQLSEKMTRPSALRQSISVRLSPTPPPQCAGMDTTTTAAESPRRPHIKVKNSQQMSSTKLFYNSFTAKNSGTTSSNSADTAQHENEDWCAACMQPGSFLCCDTCPRSFHFLCLDPPLDPDNLPDGDWSCPHCLFQQQFPTQTKLAKAQRSYQRDVARHTGSAMFAQLMFAVQGSNPRQFELPHAIRSTFADVHAGDRGRYADESEKPPVPYRVLVNAPYGQSVSKLDAYAPDNHYEVDDSTALKDDSEDDHPRFRLCYRCRQTRFGSWEHPEDSRLLITCDYCNTPWHLDCVPDVPRASLKNLGYKWKCPLHANTRHQRRLARKRYTQCRPQAQSCGLPNSGDIEIALEPVDAPGSITMRSDFEKLARGDALDIVPVVPEAAIQTDFFSKVYQYKQYERIREFRLQARLIDKLVATQASAHGDCSDMSSNKTPTRSDASEVSQDKTLIAAEPEDAASLADVLPLVYFGIGNDANLKKQWNLSELCSAASGELATPIPATTDKDSHLPQKERDELLALKRLIEAKPKSEVIKFFGLGK